MLRTASQAFYSSRAAEERAKAEAAANEHQRRVHLEMAKIFEERATAACRESANSGG